MLPADSPLGHALKACIVGGDVDGLESLLQEHPGLAGDTLDATGASKGQDVTRTMLHIATDWPGNFPRVKESIALLIAHSADPNARCTGRHEETPLHWAASCNDAIAIEALLDGGADLEAQGSIVGGGSALDAAVAFEQWHAAQCLLWAGAATSNLTEERLDAMKSKISSLVAADSHSA